GEQFYEGGNQWIEGWTEVSKGDIVRKSGCVTGITQGQVIHTNVSVVVWYGDRSAYFADQIVVTQENWSFAAPGDSGSAVDKDGEFVGLLFAGSERSAVISKAKRIIDGLGIAVEPLAGQYGLTVTSSPGGSVTEPGEGMSLHSAGEVVALVAVPDEHWHFAGWTGDVNNIANVTAAQTTITMNDSYSITANFEIDEGWYSLTTSSTEGGSVTEPGEGTSVYPAGANVTIVAQADAGSHYHFAGWTGDVATIANPQGASTNITMYDSYSITANFELDTGWNSLTISTTSGGSVTEPGQGTFVYEDGSIVDLIAQPGEGYEFVRWTGDIAAIADVNAAQTSIVMNGSYSITANFESWHPEPVALLMVSSTGGGSVTSPGEGTFDCTLGSMVILMAEANSGYQFAHWSGDVETIGDVDAATTTITMDSSYSISADFQTTSSPCCTATAAFGTPMAREIAILREFRDEYLLTDPVGKPLADLYYTVSPPIAEFITEHPGLKPIVRAGLAPAVVMSTIAVNASPAEKAALVGCLVLFAVALTIWATRRRDRGSEHS
ncbi:CFI-box-CTERM domain-containing protein, partial [Chloroflexota bacterium]